MVFDVFNFAAQHGFLVLGQMRQGLFQVLEPGQELHRTIRAVFQLSEQGLDPGPGFRGALAVKFVSDLPEMLFEMP